MFVDANDRQRRKKKLMHADVHINKNHNIFEDGYTSGGSLEYGNHLDG